MFHISESTLIKGKINNIVTTAAALRAYMQQLPEVDAGHTTRIQNLVDYLRRYAANGAAETPELEQDLEIAKNTLVEIGGYYGFATAQYLEQVTIARERGMHQISSYMLQLKAELQEMHQLAKELAESTHGKGTTDLEVQIQARINSRGLPPRDLADPDSEVQ